MGVGSIHSFASTFDASISASQRLGRLVKPIDLFLAQTLMFVSTRSVRAI